MTTNPDMNRPQTTVVLAMSADGKISDVQSSPAGFGSPNDKAHLEQQVALSDAIIFGANTLRSGGTAMRVVNPELLLQREYEGKPPQPIQIVCSRGGNIDPELKFFTQPIPRWLLTTSTGASYWQENSKFDHILVFDTPEGEIDWVKAMDELKKLGLQHLAVLGGGRVVASMLEADLIDEFWLTVCPLIFGGTTAPTPVAGKGFLQDMAPRLKLLSVKTIEQEVFLHYRLDR